jgi:hypothetical protein
MAECRQVNASRAVCKPEGARSGGACHAQARRRDQHCRMAIDRPCIDQGVNPKRLVLQLSIRTELPNSKLEPAGPQRRCLDVSAWRNQASPGPVLSDRGR